MPTAFIALQCYHCSTMQVKQQKKSSNKWRCVVCNSNQSVTKVYFRAFMAKEVRYFVQNFNMSRLHTDHHSDPPQFHQTQTLEAQNKRTDWTEYVDPEDHHFSDNDQQIGNAFEPKVVTELPKELITRPKLKNNLKGSCNNDKGFRPVFQKRNSIKKRTRHDEFAEMEPNGCQQLSRKESDELTDYTMLPGKESGKFQQWGGPLRTKGYEIQHDDDDDYGSYEMTRQQEITSRVAFRCNNNAVEDDHRTGNGDFSAKQYAKSQFAAIALKFNRNGVQHEKGSESLEVTNEYFPEKHYAKSQFASIALKFNRNGVQHEKGSESLEVTRHQKKKATIVSKWNDYITEDDDVASSHTGNSQGGSSRDLLDLTSDWKSDMYDMNLADQKVEEDIHPDFL